jgi:hypothetical protein
MRDYAVCQWTSPQEFYGTNNMPQMSSDQIPRLSSVGQCGKYQHVGQLYRARICKPFKEPRIRFPAWRAGTTTLFDVTVRHAT